MTRITGTFEHASAADVCERKLEALRGQDIRITAGDDYYMVSADVKEDVLDRAYALIRDHLGEASK
ncbi:hypothetical protein RQP50_12335 [Paenibacillus sp. chi10]|uniref:Uncharacterized protein n=1 Tax=Paenibacillus suaedae TaxID=3077233 RepID=A0AAJ2JY70_9BACL|nr:hypothetical protein [Paenibacillus sp. chi10]MDT8977030.1 hypothetical protein [Paenibacillus sp. chi10]